MADIGLRTVPGSGFGGYGYMSPSPQNSTPMGVTQSFGQQLGDSLKQGLKGFVSGLPGGLMSAGLSALGSILQYNMQNKLMDKSIKANTDQWNAENQYNDPSAQMQRMMAAGLNPNLVAGSAATGNASQMTPSTNVPSASNPISNFASVQGALKSLQSADADIRLKNAQAEELEARAGKEQAEEKVSSEYAPLVRQMFLNAGYAGEKIQMESLRIGKDIEFLNTQIRNLDQVRYGLVLDNFRKSVENQHFEDYLLSIINSNNMGARYSYFASEWQRRVVGEYIHELTERAGFYRSQSAFVSGPQTADAYSRVALNRQQLVIDIPRMAFGFFAGRHDGFGLHVDTKGNVGYTWHDTGKKTLFDESQIDRRIKNATDITDATLDVVRTGLDAYSTFATGGLSHAVGDAMTEMTTYNSQGKPIIKQKWPMRDGDIKYIPNGYENTRYFGLRYKSHL